jgi:hypothetical protein
MKRATSFFLILATLSFYSCQEPDGLWYEETVSGNHKYTDKR